MSAMESINQYRRMKIFRFSSLSVARNSLIASQRTMPSMRRSVSSGAGMHCSISALNSQMWALRFKRLRCLQKSSAICRVILARNAKKYVLTQEYEGFGIYEEVCPSGFHVHQSWLIANDKNALVCESYNNFCKEELLDMIDNYKEEEISEKNIHFCLR